MVAIQVNEEIRQNKTKEITSDLSKHGTVFKDFECQIAILSITRLIIQMLMIRYGCSYLMIFHVTDACAQTLLID